MTSLLDIKNLLASVFEKDELLLATISSPRKKSAISKITIRPILIKEQLFYQITENRQQQALHQNLSQENCLIWLQEHLLHFKQVFIYTKKTDYHLLMGKKGNFTLLKKAPTKASCQLMHNRQKEYHWQEGIPIPFLVHLGVMNKEGQVYAAKKEKFRQINRFLEMIADILPHLDRSQPLHIVDFGCGKAYLTFALYHFLKMTKGYCIQMTGLDLKKEVIQYCQELAQELGYQHDLHFICEDINNFHPQHSIDIVVSLHACDTATDAALEKAIRWQAQVILCVPCCQHELIQQVHQEHLRPLLKHGILKELFAALATDAARAQLLDILGYQTQILEFIDLENTPKNLLIRAIKRPHSKEQQQAAWHTYLNFKHCLTINPSLERRFHSDLKSLLQSSILLH